MTLVGCVLAGLAGASCGSGDSLGGQDTGGAADEDSTGADGVTGDGQTVDDDVSGADVEPGVPDGDGDTSSVPSDVVEDRDVPNDDIEFELPDGEGLDTVETDVPIALPDAIGVDLGTPDVPEPDVAEMDVLIVDVAESDVVEGDSTVTDILEGDATGPDVIESDVVEADAPEPDTSGEDTSGDDVVDICEDFSPAPYVCADGTLVAACSCADNEISCVDDPDSLCPLDGSCDDGDPLICRIPVPTCEDGTIVAIIDGCYLCVAPDTCEVPLPACESVRGAYCLVAGARTCERGTQLNTQFTCEGGDACCSTVRDTSCDDGTEPLCDRLVRECDGNEIRAVQDSCEVCVNPATCAPWGQPTCRTDQDCANDEWCNDCGSSSCPACDDCVSVCEPSRCESDSELRCRCLRPTCPDGATSVVRDGCWVCVDAFACTPVRGGCGGP